VCVCVCVCICVGIHNLHRYTRLHSVAISQSRGNFNADLFNVVKMPGKGNFISALKYFIESDINNLSK